MKTLLGSLPLVICLSLLAHAVLAQPPATIADPSNAHHNKVHVQINTKSTDASVEEFIPTHEWQPIKEGQAIPAGLHVRMDFTTGERMAKLLEAEQTNSEIVAVPESVVQFESPEEYVTKTVRPGLLARYVDLQDLLVAVTAPLLPAQDCPSEELCERAANALHILADFVDDLDHAQEFATSKAMHLIMAFLRSNSTCSQQLRNEAWLVVGSAVHNNPPVSSVLLSDGAMHLVLQDATVESLDSFSLARRWYVVSRMIRNSRDAQVLFENIRGYEALKGVLGHLQTISKSKDPRDVNVIRKVVGLVFDLVTELGSQHVIEKIGLNHVCESLADVVNNTPDDESLEEALNSLLVFEPCVGVVPRESLVQNLRNRFPDAEPLSLDAENHFDDIMTTVQSVIAKWSQVTPSTTTTSP